MAGIQKTLQTFADLQALAVDGIDLAKRGTLGLGSLARLFAIMNDIKVLVADAPAAVPELKDLDAQEAGAISSAAFTLVKAVMVAIAA